jgi:L-amino acid N-acyltransferase YncA
MWAGVGEAWFIAADRLQVSHIAIVRKLKSELHRIAAEQQFHRVQAAVRSDWKSAIRLARFVGMEHEGRMRKYSYDGADYERYAWLPQ